VERNLPRGIAPANGAFNVTNSNLLSSPLTGAVAAVAETAEAALLVELKKDIEERKMLK
jgi:hypothetical protein